MTTTIRDFFYLKAVPDHQSGPGVHVGCNNNGESHLSRNGYVSTAEFLAAVATELDVLVIPRTDLPAVDPEVNGHGADVGGDYIEVDDADDARTVGLRYLALAEYLDAHPPIDQAQVDTLANLIRTVDGAHNKGAGAIAEALIATGLVTVTDPA